MEKGFYAFGTMNYIQAAQGTQDILSRMASYCASLDDKLSVFKEKSEISQINREAGKNEVMISEETYRILECAMEYAERSNGAFDITIRPAVALWNIGQTRERIPGEEEKKKAAELIGYQSLHLNQARRTAYLEREGQAIELGSIAKGFAADAVAGKLQESGITSALLNFGGTIYGVGNRPDGTPWRVGIQNPTQKRGISVGSIHLTDGAVVTSAVNERFFFRDGRRYHHLIDPRTLEPAQSGVLGVSAAGASAMKLDAATTAFFVLGPEKGIALAHQFGMDAIFLMDDGNIYATEGFTGEKYAFEMKHTA